MGNKITKIKDIRTGEIREIGGESGFKLIETTEYINIQDYYGHFPINSPWKENTLYMIEVFLRDNYWVEDHEYAGDFAQSLLYFVSTGKIWVNPDELRQIECCVNGQNFGKFGKMVNGLGVLTPGYEDDYFNCIDYSDYWHDEETEEGEYLSDYISEMAFKIYEVCELGGNE